MITEVKYDVKREAQALAEVVTRCNQMKPYTIARLTRELARIVSGEYDGERANDVIDEVNAELHDYLRANVK